MPWRNTDTAYGLAAILMHWAAAAVVVGLFALGLWMVELTYYDPWYRRAPDIHRAVGVLLFVLMAARLAWRLAAPVPREAAGVKPLEARLAHFAHRLMYALVFAVILTGYLISTADGRPVEVFGWFSVPATITGLPNQEDVAGQVHLVLAVALVALASVHALAALKHHFIDRNRTLVRMLRPGP